MQRKREIDGGGAFSHAALARGHRNDVAHRIERSQAALDRVGAYLHPLIQPPQARARALERLRDGSPQSLAAIEYGIAQGYSDIEGVASGNDLQFGFGHRQRLVRLGVDDARQHSAGVLSRDAHVGSGRIHWKP
ncbi:hypothetical protein CDEF62S_04777 [Castellaniella defragrans]